MLHAMAEATATTNPTGSPAPTGSNDEKVDGLVRCFGMLSTGDLLNAAQVCCEWRLAANDGWLWKLAIDRDFEGLPATASSATAAAASGAGGSGAGTGTAVDGAAAPAETDAAPSAAVLKSADVAAVAPPPPPPAASGKDKDGAKPRAPAVPAPGAGAGVGGAEPARHRQRWRQLLRQWGGPGGEYVRLGLLARAVRCFRDIEGWLERHMTPSAVALRPGASDADIAAAEARLEVKLPVGLRVLYRLHDGQGVGQSDFTARHATSGLFGGTIFCTSACVHALGVCRSVWPCVHSVAVGDMKCVVDVQTTRLLFATGSHWRI